MIPFKTLAMFGPTEQMFTHKDEVDGTIRHFAATRLLEWCKLKGIQPIEFPLDYHYGRMMMRQRDLNREHIAWLMSHPEGQKKLNVPLLICDMPCNTSLTVDGNHRYTAWCVLGREFGLAYRLTQEQWTPFLVDVPEAVRREILADLPT